MASFSLVPTPSVPDTSTGCSRAGHVQLEQTAKTAQPANGAGRHGARHMLFHQFHSSVAGRDIHTGCLIASENSFPFFFLSARWRSVACGAYFVFKFDFCGTCGGAEDIRR